MDERLKIDIAEDCDLLRLNDKLLQHCQPFHCGDEDLDDFFVNDAIAYNESGMGISYCWVKRMIIQK